MGKSGFCKSTSPVRFRSSPPSFSVDCYSEVAQPGRAAGSYPEGRGIEAHLRNHSLTLFLGDPVRNFTTYELHLLAHGKCPMCGKATCGYVEGPSGGLMVNAFTACGVRINIPAPGCPPFFGEAPLEQPALEPAPMVGKFQMLWYKIRDLFRK